VGVGASFRQLIGYPKSDYSIMHIARNSTFQKIWYFATGTGEAENMIVTVASFKGGVGKTTTSVHLAAYLASSVV